MEIFLARHPGEERHHVLADFRIEGGEIGQVEAAMNVGVPPGENEVGDTASLAGIAVGDVEQLFEGEPDAIFHGREPL
jgi:hypothetical protein